MNILSSSNDYPVKFVAAIDEWLACHLCGNVPAITVKAIFPNNTIVICLTRINRMKDVITNALDLYSRTETEGGAE